MKMCSSIANNRRWLGVPLQMRIPKIEFIELLYPIESAIVERLKE